ncbi:MAG: hypothetical protein QM820_17250 [Minicystis sp.]
MKGVRAASIGSLLLLFACKPPEPPAPPVPAPQPSAQAPAEQKKLDVPQQSRLGELLNPTRDEKKSSDSAPANNGGEATTPPPSVWTNAPPGAARSPVSPSEADRLAIARLLCESPKVGRAGSGFRCKTCPSYTDFAGMDNGMDLTFFPGRFSGPGREEVVVAMRGGCESGARSGQTYGGRALVRRMPDGWQRTYYQAGALGDCTPIFSRAGRSRLVCHLVSGHMGEYEETFALVSFDEAAGQPDERDEGILLLFTSDVAYLRRTTQKPLNVVTLQRHALLGKAQYEAGDDHALALEATVQSRVDCVGGASGCPGVDRSTFDSPLRFVFDGSAFHLAPESKAAFDRLQTRNQRE